MYLNVMYVMHVIYVAIVVHTDLPHGMYYHIKYSYRNLINQLPIDGYSVVSRFLLLKILYN